MSDVDAKATMQLLDTDTQRELLRVMKRSLEEKLTKSVHSSKKRKLQHAINDIAEQLGPNDHEPPAGAGGGAAAGVQYR